MSSQVIVHCVRHAEGTHNVGSENWALPDPHLTVHGEEQCRLLRDEHFLQSSRLKFVVASPMTRTLQTALLVFGSANGASRILALPDIQETTEYPCDLGSDLGQLKDEVERNKWPIDLQRVEEGWNIKKQSSRYSATVPAIETRADDARSLLWQLAQTTAEDQETDVHIALVSHGSFLHFLTNDWEDCTKHLYTGWRNCEVRSYQLLLSHRGNVTLTETDESRNGRGKLDPRPTAHVQRSLYHDALKQWENQGIRNLMN